MKASGIITLTTDFGVRDPYAGAMKGVILSVNPKACIIDITHEISPGSVREASAVIRESCLFYPKGSVHVCVVDPGVGSNRRPIVLETEKYFFVGPDNGIFWPIMEISRRKQIVHLKESRYFLPHVSHTFHGRDIFAPTAAHLSGGLAPIKLGPLIRNPVPLDMERPERKGNALSGRVVRVDRFGNLITNIEREMLGEFLGNAQPVVRMGDLAVTGLRRTYSDAVEGETLALIGSSGTLELAVNLGRACNLLGESPEGMVVEVEKI